MKGKEGMIIEIGKEYRINATDGINWSLQRRKVPKEGKFQGQDFWVDLGHHSNPATCLETLVLRHAHDKPTKVLAQNAAAEIRMVFDDVRRYGYSIAGMNQKTQGETEGKAGDGKAATSADGARQSAEEDRRASGSGTESVSLGDARKRIRSKNRNKKRK